jgi:predicted secreted protein
MGRVFATTAVICAVAFAFWFIVIHGPGSQITPGQSKS